jgi:hypothetical protein
MEANIKKTPMPIVAGVLDIISGAVGLIAVLGLIIAIVVIGSPSIFWGNVHGFVPEVSAAFIQNILLVITIPLSIVSLLALIGGIYALQRKIWGLALAGSIAAMIASIPILGGLPVGITATILTAISKGEFD